MYKDHVNKYLVLRTYSQTNTRELLRVMSRPIMDVLSASVNLEMTNIKASKKQEAFLVKIISDTDDEINLNKQILNSWHAGYNECLKRVKEGTIKI